MDAKNVSAAAPKVTGAVFVAPIGTELPTDAKTELPEAYKELGYVSDAGLVNSNSPSTTDVKEWGGTVVMSSLTDKPDNFKFKLIEVLRLDVLKTVYGSANVTQDETGKITIKAKAEDPENMIWVFDMILSGKKLKRIIVSDGKITTVGDIEYTKSNASGFDLTIAAYPDSENSTHTEYIESAEEKAVSTANEEAVSTTNEGDTEDAVG